MQVSLSPNVQNASSLTVTPDVGQYALVTMDGDNAGTFSVLAVPDTGWDDAIVKAAVLAWFSFQEQA